MDSDHDKSFGDISVRTGEIVLVRYNDDTTPDEENDTDGNGIINTYTGASNTRLKVGGDQVVLYDDDGNISDAVAWTFNDTLSSGTEADDMADLFDEGEWVSAENSSCVDSEDVPEGWSISRSKGDADTDSKADWYIIEIPEPGVFRNLTNTLPDIADVTMDPTPVHDTILPLTNVTVTAAITDDAAILSANITWSLNGTAQGRIPMNDNATLPDLDAGDDNWTGVIPGQPADSVVIFSIEATDASLETGTAGPFTITFSEPPKMLTIRITEVMFSPVSGNNWVEIFCQEDGNGGTGYDLTDWYVDDLDGDPDLTFEGTIVKTGEYILVHFDNGSSSENNSQAGNGDGIIDVFTTASDGTLSSGGDQVVLYDAADQPVDAVAWQRDGTLSAHEQTDMADLLSSVMWDSSAIDSCLDVTTLSTGESLSRMFNVTGDAYLDSNGKADWFISDDPTPGEGLPPPEPFVFEFTTLTADVEMAPPTKLFTVTWSVGGDAALISLANLTLCYLEGDLNAPEVFITYLEPEDEEYVWNVSGLDDGDYYLRVKVNDGMNPPYTVNTTYPLRIAPFPVPEVTSTVPLDGAGKLDVHTAITIVFSTEVKPDSLIIGTTVDISPATDGEATVNSGNTVVITPDDLLRYDTLYTVTVDNVRSVHDIVMDDSYEFSFTTETEPLWELSARIGTDNATVEIDGKEVDLVGGAFSVMRANGSYELKVTAEGFVAYTKTVRIDGDDATLPEITLEPELTDVPIGPFVFKGTTDCIEGVNVYFNLDGEKHSSDTDSDGYARFTIPGKEIPDGIEITALYGGKKVSCIWPDDDALYDSFEKEKGDDDDGDGENGEKGANTVLWIVLISLVIVIVGVIVAIVVVLLRSKKETAAPGQYEPGEEVSTEEPEWDGEGEADAEEAGTEVTTEELPEEGTEGGEIPADAPLADENGTAQAGTDDGGVEEAGTEQAEAEGGETGEGVSTALAEHDGNAAGMAPLENVFAPFPEGSEGSEEDLLDDN